MTFPGVVFPSPFTFPSGTDRDITLSIALAGDRFRLDLAAGRFTLSIGADVPRTISTSLGAVEYASATLTEVNGADITSAVLEVSLGSSTTPGTWQAPDSVTHPTASTALVKLLVGGSGVTPTAGRYWLWCRVSDTPELVPVCALTAIRIN